MVVMGKKACYHTRVGHHHHHLHRDSSWYITRGNSGGGGACPLSWTDIICPNSARARNLYSLLLFYLHNFASNAPSKAILLAQWWGNEEIVQLTSPRRSGSMNKGFVHHFYFP